MYSNLVKYTLILISFSPILFSYWLVTVLKDVNSLRLYFDFSIKGIKNFLDFHWSLIVFTLMVLICRYLFSKGLKTLSIGHIELDSSKPVDVNLNPILISYILPWFKFIFKDYDDFIFLIGSLLIYCIIIFIGKSSYHYNLILRLLGYKNYEVQTKRKIGYLMISKKAVTDLNKVSKYIKISDHMIVNVSNSNAHGK